MACRITVDAGICGYKTTIKASSDELATVKFEIVSDCDKIRRLAEALKDAGPIDACAEAGAGSDGAVLSAARENLRGCCSACVTGVAVFKAMQVAAGLALPRDIHLEIEKE